MTYAKRGSWNPGFMNAATFETYGPLEGDDGFGLPTASARNSAFLLELGADAHAVVEVGHVRGRVVLRMGSPGEAQKQHRHATGEAR
jgi:hypothetical protein